MCGDRRSGAELCAFGLLTVLWKTEGAAYGLEAIIAPRFWYGDSASGTDQIRLQLVVEVWFAAMKFCESVEPQA